MPIKFDRFIETWNDCGVSKDDGPPGGVKERSFRRGPTNELDAVPCAQ
jgi:hypothetical protein